MTEVEQLPNKNAPRDRLVKFFVYGTLVLMLGGCVGSMAIHRNEVTPPSTMKDFESFLREMRTPRSLMVLQQKDNLILVATGDLSLLAGVFIPSGPPQYVFSADGKLVDWVGDSGEGKSWRPGTLTPLVKSLTVPEARIWLAEQKSAAPANPN